MLESENRRVTGNRTAFPVRSADADDPAFQELIEMFVAALPEKHHSLEEAYRNGAIDELCRHAHQLKGAGGGYGFADLSVRAAELEDACKSQDRERIGRNLAAVLVYLECISP